MHLGSRYSRDRQWLEQASITFGEIAGTLSMLNVECSRCERHGRFNTAKLVERRAAIPRLEGLSAAYLSNACSGCVPSVPDLMLLPRNLPRTGEDQSAATALRIFP
jgi:hypothetical protein